MTNLPDEGNHGEILQEAKTPGARCWECPLQSSPFAPSHGPDEARIVLVGEAPGIEETQRKKPFVGKSGRLIDQVLEYHKIDRDTEVFVTNTCLCRPPKKARKQTPPPKEAIVACHDRLVQEIRAHKPTHIIAAGAVATKAVLGTVHEKTIKKTGEVKREVKYELGIKEARIGEFKESPHFPKVKVVPTYHPAAAMRSPDLLPTIVKDIEKIVKVQVKWEHTKYRVEEHVEHAVATLRKQFEYAHDTLAIDPEWDHEHPEDSRNFTDWLSIGISHKPGAAVVYAENVVKDPYFQSAVERCAEATDKLLVWHNGKGDITRLWQFAPSLVVDEDTMLSHFITDERPQIHDLANVANTLLGAPNWKKEEKSYLPRAEASLRHLPLDVLHRYNATDVDVTHRLVEPLYESMIEEDVLRPYHELLIPGSNALAHVEKRGVEIDIPYLEDLDKELAPKLEEAEEKVCEAAGLEINPRSPQQIMKWCHEHGFKVRDTNAKTLAPLHGKHKFFRALATYKKDHKIHSTYVLGLLKQVRDGRIHCNFNLQTVETGRLSSSEPNLQNIPIVEAGRPNVRRALRPSEGCVFLSADYKAIEYRLGAIFSQDPAMLKAFREGRNFHEEVALQLFGENYDKRQYTNAKNTNFGIFYKETEHGLAKQLGIPEKEALALIEGWHHTFKRVRPWQDSLEKEILDNGFLTSYFGRKRRFWYWTRETWMDVVREACNFPLQSAASDLNLAALIRLQPMLEGKAWPVITVHDSLVFEVKVEYLEEVAWTVKRVMEDTELNEIVPIIVELAIGDSWGTEEEYILEAA